MPEDTNRLEDVVEGIVYNGGGWYQLPDGKKVQGRDKAQRAYLMSQNGDSDGAPDYRRLMVLNEIISRMDAQRALGKQFEGQRDIWESLSYPDDIEYRHYRQAYERQDIASRIIDLPAKTTWRNEPEVMAADENDEPLKDHEFSREFKKLKKELRLFHKMERADILNRLGRYSVIVVGAADNFNVEGEIQDVNDRQDVEYLSTFGEDNVDVNEVDLDPGSARFGLPVEYDVELGGDLPEDLDIPQSQLTPERVHHSRIIHVAEGRLDNEVFGTPALEKIYNRLIDLSKMVGAGAEAFWREVQPIWNIDLDPETQLSDPAKDELKEGFERLIHGMQRGLRTQGGELKKIGASIQDPSNPFDVIISLIAAATGVPKRILLGSERGDLASTQDQAAFMGMIAERQTTFAEPVILRPFIDLMISIGALPEPPNGEYVIEWPNLFELTEVEKAQVLEAKANALNQAEQAAVSGQVAAISEIRTDFLELPEDRPDQQENQAEMQFEDGQGDEDGPPEEGGQTPTDNSVDRSRPEVIFEVRNGTDNPNILQAVSLGTRKLGSIQNEIPDRADYIIIRKNKRTDTQFVTPLNVNESKAHEMARRMVRREEDEELRTIVAELVGNREGNPVYESVAAFDFVSNRDGQHEGSSESSEGPTGGDSNPSGGNQVDRDAGAGKEGAMTHA